MTTDWIGDELMFVTNIEHYRFFIEEEYMHIIFLKFEDNDNVFRRHNYS